MWKLIMILDYYQKPASVDAFYKSYLGSNFRSLLDFAAAVSQLCAHGRHNDGCLVCQFSLCFDWKETGTHCIGTSGWQLGKFVDFVKTNNKQIHVFQSHNLYLWDKIRKIDFPGHKLIFMTQYQNSRFFHGREQNFKFGGFFRFPGSVGTLDISCIRVNLACHWKQQDSCMLWLCQMQLH